MYMQVRYIEVWGAIQQSQVSKKRNERVRGVGMGSTRSAEISQVGRWVRRMGACMELRNAIG
jgi:hypothetical protein